MLNQRTLTTLYESPNLPSRSSYSQLHDQQVLAIFSVKTSSIGAYVSHSYTPPTAGTSGDARRRFIGLYSLSLYW